MSGVLLDRRPGGRWRAVAVALGAVLLGACGSPPDPPRRARPNIVLVTIDSLRADHVGCYGGRLRTTPALDALAAEGIVFEDVQAVTSWTLPAHASLFTGLYPSAVQVTGATDRLGDGYTTLAERLRAAGYQTAGVVSGPYLKREHNLHQGFELYLDDIARVANPHAAVTNPKMTTAIEEFLDQHRDPARPFFLFAYYWDPHYDYVPPAPYDALFRGPAYTPIDLSGYGVTNTVNRTTRQDQMAYVLSQYDGEIRWTDDHLGRLFAMLRERGLWDDTVILVTSDHGEQFFEHGMKGHKASLFVEELHVPLVLKLAGPAAPRRDPRLASQVDVTPTLLELAGQPPVTDVPLAGQSLLAATGPERSVFAELDTSVFVPRPDGGAREVEQRWRAIVRGPHKLLQSDELEALFDRIADPAEFRDRRASEPMRVGELHERLDAWQARAADVARRYEDGGATPLSDEDIEALRALGYVQ